MFESFISNLESQWIELNAPTSFWYKVDADDIQAELDNDEEDEEFSKDWGLVQMMNGNISSSKNARNIPSPTQCGLYQSGVNSLDKNYNLSSTCMHKSYV